MAECKNLKKQGNYLIDVEGIVTQIFASNERVDSDGAVTLVNCEIAFQLKRIADVLENFATNGVPVEKIP